MNTLTSNILTGNDLRSGAVVWWAGAGWSAHVDDAVAVDDAAEAIIARESAARRVVGAYVVAATREGGHIRPAHIKERVRALGPTCRLDLSQDPTATPDRVL